MAKFTTTTISNYNQSPPPDDGSTGDDNLVKWSGIKTKLSDPTKNYIDSIQNNVKTAFGNLYVNIEVYSSDLETAVNAIGASKTALVIKSSTTVSNDVTVPSNITLMFLHGGDLNVSATKTVTINGDIQAGKYQIFTGAGTVTLGSSSSDIVADWYGATPGGTGQAAPLQAAITAWTTKGRGKLIISPGDYDTGSTELEINFPNSQHTILLEAWGATIAPSADIDSGNGYALKVTRDDFGGSPDVTTRNHEIVGLKVRPSAGNCGGIEVDGKATATGFLYRFTMNRVIVESVTRHGIFLTGNFFESSLNDCAVSIPTNESGYHGIFIDEDGNDAASGDISSIEVNFCSVSGGENNVRCSGAGDGVKIRGGTYLLAGKEAIKSSTSGNLEQVIDSPHIENCWNGVSAVPSASFAAGTSQAAINIIGRGQVRSPYIVSSNDTLRQGVRTYALGPISVEGVIMAAPEATHIVRAGGTSSGKVRIQSCESTLGTLTAVVDENEAANVHWTVRACGDSPDYESRKTFADLDATPSVAAGNYFLVANTGATTITNLDDGVQGQVVTLQFSTANTTIDFSGTNMKGNGGVDWTPPAQSIMVCRRSGSNWHCLIGSA